MIFVKSNGVNIAARSTRDALKPALVLLHGWPQSSRAFENVLPELGVDNFVIAFDLPGIGASPDALPSAKKPKLPALYSMLLSSSEPGTLSSLVMTWVE